MFSSTLNSLFQGWGSRRGTSIQRLVRGSLCCAIRKLRTIHLKSRCLKLALALLRKNGHRNKKNAVRTWTSRHVQGMDPMAVETHDLCCEEARLALINLGVYYSK